MDGSQGLPVRYKLEGPRDRPWLLALRFVSVATVLLVLDWLEFPSLSLPPSLLLLLPQCLLG